MSNEWNAQAFLESLRNAQSQPRSTEQQVPQLRKTYLTVPDNFGRYQIFPMLSTTTGMPFEYLYKTREVNIVVGKKQDGTDRSTWFKLLPVTAYNTRDFTGNPVSELSESELRLLESAHGVFDRLMEVVPDAQRKNICRVKNYTVGNAYVIHKYSARDIQKPTESGFSSLLICTSKDFANAINKDIDMQMINHGNDPSWLSEIYNRKLEGRTGWLIFNIGPASNGIGYSVNAAHTTGIQASVSGSIKIPESDAELMQDPIRTFLGRQAGEDRLFNGEVIQKVIDEMNMLISKFSNSAAYVNMAAAAQATNNAAQQVMAYGKTNDPMLQGNMSDPSHVAAMNNNPYVNPPSAQFDPMAGVPSGYVQPSFAQNAVPNPFETAQPNPFVQGNN